MSHFREELASLAGRKKLTKKLVRDVGQRIREGAFIHVAAQACGIHKATFYRWLDRGQADDASVLEIEFYETVTQSRAQARAMAETELFRTDPYKWLRYGPGRDRPDDEGWASETTVSVTNDGPAPIIQLYWDDEGPDDPDDA